MYFSPRQTIVIIALLFLPSVLHGITRSNLLAAKPITKALTITTPGVYKLAYSLEGPITISASNVMLNLNKCTLTGTATHGIVINSSAAHVVIENGNIGAITGGNGIEITSGCDDITLRNLNICTCDYGINIASSSSISVHDCLVGQCIIAGIKFSLCSKSRICRSECVGNPTGILIDQTTGTYLQNVTAIASTVNGISFTASDTSTLIHCKALQTESNTTTNAHGFIADNSTRINFLSCIADNTKTNATDEAYHACGFMIRNGSSNCSITKCHACNTYVPSGSNAYVYAVNTEETLDDLSSTETRDFGYNLHATNWSPDGLALAIAGEDSGSESIELYTLNNSTGKLKPYSSFDTNAAVYALAWSPNSSFLATGGAQDKHKHRISLYFYEKSTKSLTKVDGDKNDDDILTVAWNPQTDFLASGDDNQKVRIHTVDLSKGTIKRVAYVNVSDAVSQVAWSPNGLFLAIVTQATSDNIKLYEFSPAKKTLTSRDTKTHAAALHAAQWSSDGKYLAVAGAPAASVDTLIYEFDSTAKTLTLRDSVSHGAQVNTIAWAENGKYMTTGGVVSATNRIRMYSFSYQNKALTLQDSAAGAFDTINSIAWSPHGLYLAICGDRANSITHEILKALNFPKKNVIRDTITCNTEGGGTNERSFGISAANGVNFIYNNITYNGHKPFCFSNGLHKHKHDKSYNFSSKDDDDDD